MSTSWISPAADGVFYPLSPGSGTSQLPETFHTALIRMLRGDAPLQAMLGSPARIFKEWPGAKAKLPYIVVEAYVEEQPGETLDIQVLSAMLSVRAFTQPETTRIGRRIKKVVDTPSQSDESERPYALVWSDGQETACLRQPSSPPARLSRTYFGVDAFQWTLAYEFHYQPTGQAG
jgi:hypothetical protein